MNNYNSLCMLLLVLFCMLTVQWTGITSADEFSAESDGSVESRHFRKLRKFASEEEIKRESAEYDGDMDLDAKIVNDANWDVIIFTQQWPVTLCYHWREEDKDHSCVLPTSKEFWTIHGIWPTKLGELGPSFCNKSADFDFNQLVQIEQRLLQYWPDIAGNTKDHENWLWKHEWLKHGTCAALLQSLDNERKYFSQGLHWREKYNISSIFDISNILPDSVNTVITLQTALLKVLGKNPSIHCVYDHKKDVNFLSEIRLCFNKQLELINCDGIQVGDAVNAVHPGGTVITNCHISKPVYYPSMVPPLVHRQYNNRNRQWQYTLVNLYKLLQFIMWSTL